MWCIPPPTKRERFLKLQIGFAGLQRSHQLSYKFRAEKALGELEIKLTPDEKKFFRAILADAEQRIKELDSQIDLLERQCNSEFWKRRRPSTKKKENHQ